MITEKLLLHFSGDHLLDRMARYHLSTGGKCLRGRLALAEATALSMDLEKAFTWGVSCELLHNATLIHDDIQDNDPIRRGQPSLWKKYGLSQAINAGDYLIFKSFHLASSLNSSDLPFQLAQTAELLVRGQSDELESIKKDKHGSFWTSYLEMAKLKTGTLFLLPPQGVHIINGQKMNDKAKECWLTLGICYQIFDDIRDFLGLKQQGQQQKDFVEKRLNAIVALLSTQAEFSELIESYLDCQAYSIQQTHVIQAINRAVETESIIERLNGFAQNLLNEFKIHTYTESQNLILGFLNQAIEKGASNATISI